MGRSEQRPEFSQATGMTLVRCILNKFLGIACHCFPPAFLDVPTSHHRVPPRPPRRERSQRRKWELWARMLSGNFAEMTTSTPFWGSFTCSKSTTWDRRLYFPSEGRRAEDFFALKNPRTWVLKASTLPLDQRFSNCGPRTTGGLRVLPLWSF